MRVPTEQQYDRLRILGAGAMVLVPSRREWEPLMRHGWVTGVLEDNGARFLPPLRITPVGLIALAAAVERYGLPDVVRQPRQVDEPAFLAKLRRDLDEAKLERDAARLQAHTATMLLRQIKRMVGPLEAA